MLNPKNLNLEELLSKLPNPQHLAQSLAEQVSGKAAQKLDLVTRAEYELLLQIQQQTRQQLLELSAEVERLESLLQK